MNKKQLQIADIVLTFYYKNRQPTSIQNAFNTKIIEQLNYPGHREYRDDLTFVRDILSNKYLIDNNINSNDDYCKITSTGIQFIQDHETYTVYINHQKIEEEKAQTKANKQRKWDSFMKIVNDFNAIGKAVSMLVPAILFILSIIFSEQVSVTKKAVFDFLRPNTTTQQATTISDTIQQQKIINGH